MKRAAWVVEQMMERALRRSFQKVCWLGERPALPAGTPVVLYANHHHFYDGYLAWLLVRRVLHRSPITWMEDWDRFPFFGAVGALPFPKDDPRRRSATLRTTIRRLRAAPDSVLVYFPEGRLHAPEEGIAPFDPTFLRRLDSLFPDAAWWPVGIHVTWRGGEWPAAFLHGGTVQRGIDGQEPDRLQAVWQAARTPEPEPCQVLLEGRCSTADRWNFAWLQRWFDEHA